MKGSFGMDCRVRAYKARVAQNVQHSRSSAAPECGFVVGHERKPIGAQRMNASGVPSTGHRVIELIGV